MDIAQKSDRFPVAPMMGLFLMAFFMKRTNRQGAWAQVVVTFVIAFYVTFYQELNAWLFQRDVYISFTWIFPFSLAAGLVVGYAVSLLFPPPPEAAGEETEWKETWPREGLLREVLYSPKGRGPAPRAGPQLIRFAQQQSSRSVILRNGANTHHPVAGVTIAVNVDGAILVRNQGKVHVRHA